jgi:REP element-mobilizing transposase RayT
MGNTYTQLFVHIVFVVSLRQRLISESHREEVEKYICGILKNDNCTPVAIFCNPDHTHILFGFEPNLSISDIARDVKANSSRFINEHNWFQGSFNWQKGFGAFSCSKSQLGRISTYIKNQPVHHQKKKLKDEYIALLKKHEIEYDERYLFDWTM